MAHIEFGLRAYVEIDNLPASVVKNRANLIGHVGKVRVIVLSEKEDKAYYILDETPLILTESNLKRVPSLDGKRFIPRYNEHDKPIITTVPHSSYNGLTWSKPLDKLAGQPVEIYGIGYINGHPCYRIQEMQGILVAEQWLRPAPDTVSAKLEAALSKVMVTQKYSYPHIISLEDLVAASMEYNIIRGI